MKTRAELIAARLAPQPNPTDPTDPEDSAEGSGAQRQVRVSPGEQAGLTHWDAQLPAEASVAMWAAVETLAAQYRAGNPDLTVAQSRADALADLVLSDVHVSTTATLIIPTTSAPTTSAPTTCDSDAGVPAAEQAPAPSAPAESTSTPADPESGPAGGRPVGALTKLTPPPPCDCAAQRSRPWLDLLDPFAHPSVIVGGSWAQDRPDPPLHARFQTVVRQAREVDANPNLARDWHGRTWFVPKPVLIPPVGMLLPAQVNAILANPDTHLRLGAAHPATGAVEHLDERTYRPGAALARMVRARDGTCRYPGCATPAARCDLDHITPYPTGPTTAANLQTLCRTHHGFKHHGGWTVTMTPHGICTWTAPNGRTHTTHPHNLHDDAA